jgi:hypothetical protein
LSIAQGANILYTKSGICKLADFGSCSNAFRDEKMTMIGTPFWMAPELISQSGGGKASDIWSIGCTTLELFTGLSCQRECVFPSSLSVLFLFFLIVCLFSRLIGTPPYWKLGPNVALFRMVEDAHPPLPAEIPQDFEEFLLGCFLKDEKARFTAAELLVHPWLSRHSVLISQDGVTGNDMAKDGLEDRANSINQQNLQIFPKAREKLLERTQISMLHSPVPSDRALPSSIPNVERLDKAPDTPKSRKSMKPNAGLESDIERSVSNWAGTNLTNSPVRKNIAFFNLRMESSRDIRPGKSAKGSLIDRSHSSRYDIERRTGSGFRSDERDKEKSDKDQSLEDLQSPSPSSVRRKPNIAAIGGLFSSSSTHIIPTVSSTSASPSPSSTSFSISSTSSALSSSPSPLLSSNHSPLQTNSPSPHVSSSPQPSSQFDANLDSSIVIPPLPLSSLREVDSNGKQITPKEGKDFIQTDVERKREKEKDEKQLRVKMSLLHIEEALTSSNV